VPSVLSLLQSALYIFLLIRPTYSKPK